MRTCNEESRAAWASARRRRALPRSCRLSGCHIPDNGLDDPHVASYARGMPPTPAGVAEVLALPDREYDAYTFDLDGTIYLGDGLLPGARALVDGRSEERRVGKACRCRWPPAHST